MRIGSCRVRVKYRSAWEAPPAPPAAMDSECCCLSTGILWPLVCRHPAFESSCLAIVNPSVDGYERFQKLGESCPRSNERQSREPRRRDDCVFRCVSLKPKPCAIVACAEAFCPGTGGTPSFAFSAYDAHACARARILLVHTSTSGVSMARRTRKPHDRPPGGAKRDHVPTAPHPLLAL